MLNCVLPCWTGFKVRHDRLIGCFLICIVSAIFSAQAVFFIFCNFRRKIFSNFQTFLILIMHSASCVEKNKLSTTQNKQV